MTTHHFSGLGAPFVRSKGTVSGGVFTLSFCVGVGLTQTDGNFFSAFPSAVGDIFNGNAVAGVFVVALLLSLFLPKSKDSDED